MPDFLTSLKFETLRTLGFGSISGTYANVGAITVHPWRIFYVTNTTDADMIFSTNGGVTDHFVVPAGQSLSMDGSANGLGNNAYIPQGTQFAVKQVSAPSKGSVYIAGVFT